MDARKGPLGEAEAIALAGGASRVVVARGKKIVDFDMKKSPPDEATLLSHMLGPTGNMRAPTVKKGKILIVGFNDDVYADILA